MILSTEEDAQGKVFSLDWGSVFGANGAFIYTDEDLAILAEFPDLERLPLPPGAGDAGLRHVAALKRLQSLQIEQSFTRFERSKVTDEGLAQLTSLETLTHLDLGAARVTDAGMKHLGKLKNLEELALEKAQLTDDGVEQLLTLESLKELKFDGTRLTTKGLDQLAKMPKLKHLHLGSLPRQKLESIRRSYPQIGFNGLIPFDPDVEEE
jgi:hypothetical protein